MTTKRKVLYGLTLALVLTGALIAEIAPFITLGLISCAVFSARAAERS